MAVIDGSGERVRLGDRVRDVVTGFTGVASGYAVYLNGCVQWMVSPPVGADSTVPDTKWIDEERLKVVKSGAVVIERRTMPGGPVTTGRMSPKH